LWQRTTSDDFKVGEVTGLFLASISENEDGGEEIVFLLKENGYTTLSFFEL
jgi:hypothetical protein